MKYTCCPESVTLQDITSNQHILAPSRFSIFLSKEKSDLDSLGELITLRNERIQVIPSREYSYIEIGDINTMDGDVNSTSFFGAELPSKTPLNIKSKDILISTVRTYRRGIGFVNLDDSNLVGSPAILVISDVKKPLTKEYLFAVLRSDFFIEQILSLQNRGMYPRLDRDSIDFIKVPIPSKKETLDYITILQKVIFNKQKQIRDKNNAISNLVMNELERQKSHKFKFSYPNFNEIIKLNRLDTRAYTEEFKQIDFLIKNYSDGYYYIEHKDIKSGNTPKDRFIGNNLSYKYRWITPSNISDRGTLAEEERIDCKLNNLNRDALLLINRTSKGGRGEYVGISMYYSNALLGASQHNQGIYRVTSYPTVDLQFMATYLNQPLIRKYCAGLAIGSKMKEIKASQFATIPIPKFPDPIKNKIATTYYHSVVYPKDISILNLTEKDQIWNNCAGIFQIDMTMKLLKLKIEEVLHQIVLGKKPDLSLNFIS